MGLTPFFASRTPLLLVQIVEEAGFKGVWASGLSVSAQMGVRDANEASWTQVCAGLVLVALDVLLCATLRIGLPLVEVERRAIALSSGSLSAPLMLLMLPCAGA